MIDIHCHMVPGLDDGPPDLAQALDMARAARRSGIDRVIMTPHFLNPVYPVDLPAVEAGVRRFRRALEQEKIGLEIFMGAEIRLTHDVGRMLDKGLLPSLGGSAYYLFELPDIFIQEGVFRVLEQVREMGAIPVLAHPERNYTLMKKPGLIQAFVDKKVMFQLTGESVLGKNGNISQKICREMIGRDQAHFIASDGHDATVRKPVLENVFAAVKKMRNEQTAQKILRENPEMILDQANGKQWRKRVS